MTDFVELDIDYSLLNIGLFQSSIINQNDKNTVIINTYEKEYEERTTEYYKTLRFRKMDPIINIDLDDSNAFKFEYMWDPYTGERKEKDPHGPLYFDPDTLIHYFYTSRLKNLWNEPIDETGGYYEGYYDILVGAGENLNIIGRGECPEKYLFRLPIIDCYLEKNYNKSIITMGPKLTDNEIKLIDEIANKNANNYKLMFKKNRPSLYEMKKYYDIAINNNPTINYDKQESDDVIKTLKYKENCNAVDKLRNM